MDLSRTNEYNCAQHHNDHNYLFHVFCPFHNKDSLFNHCSANVIQLIALDDIQYTVYQYLARTALL